MRNLPFIAVSAIGLTTVNATAHGQNHGPPVYAESEGVFVIEVEDARRTGDWHMVEDETATGGAYAHWRGPNRYDPSKELDPLIYCLRIAEAGEYNLRVRVKRSRLDDPSIREDERNDLWVRLEGGEWMKLFANTAWEQWGWGGGLDFHHLNAQRPAATLTFEDQGVSCLQVAGRSEDVRLDRLHLARHRANADASLPSTRSSYAGQNGLPEFGLLNHPMTFDFAGPETSETSELNPFADYRLVLSLVPPGSEEAIHVRGFYAADGNAADSGTASGNVWRTMFTPDAEGVWQWTARLARGTDIAIDQDPAAGETIALNTMSGVFEVGSSPAPEEDWRSRRLGRLIARDGDLVAGGGVPWLKTGTNSPENLLAYEGFDGTYRMGSNAREGEADSGELLHRFAVHEADWIPGDPLWAEDRGRSLVGAVNYLADKGVNAAYFLVWNVEGDGKDVWPFVEPEDPTRFDVSKLAQWEVVFSHMQASGIALHLVLQETENELLMDEGDTGRIRKLFIAEMAARFGHHNALIWNLGEENGPVHWRPEGQNHAQRVAMVEWLTQVDPYDHPILLHTHSEPDDKDAIAGPMLGVAGLDGLSFQISDPAIVHRETLKWSRLSQEAGRPWILTMDEIGPWQHGAIPDADSDDNHLALLRGALWGHLLGGGSGVEWYFGAEHNHNDLTAEDFRSRQQVWTSSAAARRFLTSAMDLNSRQPCPPDVSDKPCLVGRTPEEGVRTVIVYLSAGDTLLDDVASGATSIEYRDPLDAETTISSGPAQDRIALVRY